MNIEKAIDILTQKENIDLSNHFNNTIFFEAIYTLLTAYENLKSYNKGTKEALRVAEDLEHQANKEAGDWEARCFELEAELEKEKEKNKEYKNLLIDMVNQFAYEENNFKTSGSSEQKIYTAGLSTLEDAFYLLDIDEGIKREDLWKLKEE